MSIYESNDSVVLVNEKGNVLKLSMDENRQKITFKILSEIDESKPCFGAPIEVVEAIDNGFGEIYDEVKVNNVKTNEYYTYATYILRDSKLLMLGDESTILSIMRTDADITFYICDSGQFIKSENTFNIYAERDNYLFSVMSNMIKKTKEEKNQYVKKFKIWYNYIIKTLMKEHGKVKTWREPMVVKIGSIALWIHLLVVY